MILRQPMRVPLPGLTQPVGFGSAIARALANVGVKPCAKCEQRKQFLNQRIQFVPPQRRMP